MQCLLIDAESDHVFTRSQSLVSTHELLPKPIRIKEETSNLSILPQNNPTTLIITTPVNISSAQSSNSDPVRFINIYKCF